MIFFQNYTFNFSQIKKFYLFIGNQFGNLWQYVMMQKLIKW